MFTFWMLHEAFNQVFYREAKKLIDRKDVRDDPSLNTVREHNRKWLKGRDPALAPYDFAVALLPRDSRPWLARARRLADLKRDKEAAADFAKSVELGPKDPAVWAARGREYASLGRLDEAAKDFAQALNLTPAPQVSWWPHPADLRAELAGDDALYERVARLRKDDQHLRACRVLHFGTRGRWAEAERAMRDLLALKPIDLWSWVHAGHLALAAKDDARYRTAARALEERFADSGVANELHQAGFALLLAGPIKDPKALGRAAGMVEAAAKKDPNVWFVQGHALGEYRRGRLPEARRLLERARGLPSASAGEAERLSLLALVEQGEGRRGAAREALARARAALKRQGREPGNWRGPDPLWHVHARAEVLLREAEAAVEGKKEGAKGK